MRVAGEIRAVDTLRVTKSLGVQQSRAEPVASRKGQREGDQRRLQARFASYVLSLEEHDLYGRSHSIQ